MNRIFQHAFGAAIGEVLKYKVRGASLKAVKAYVKLVEAARATALNVVFIALISSILVSGIVFLLMGIAELLPLSPLARAYGFIGLGVVMAGAAGLVLILSFSEKKWLKESKSYELMEAVLNPWPGILPPNPLKSEQATTPLPEAGTRPLPDGPAEDLYALSRESNLAHI